MIQYENEYAWKCAPPWQKRHDIEGEFRIIVSEVSFLDAIMMLSRFLRLFWRKWFPPPRLRGYPIIILHKLYLTFNIVIVVFVIKSERR